MVTHTQFGKTKMALSIAITVAGASQVQAQAENPDNPFQEIWVTERSIESTLPQELARYGADVEVLTGELVRQHGYVDVAQALEMSVPGMQITTQAGAFSYIDVAMQGSRSSDVLWTVDGVRINNRLYNSTSPADTLPASMIERTEVLKGSHGMMYGTQAIAGVINVVTRGFSDETEGAITVGAGGQDTQRLNGYLSGSLGDHKLVSWFSHDKTDGYEIYDQYQPSAVNKKRGYDVNSIGLKYGYDFTEDLSISLSGIETDAALDYPNVSNTNINDRLERIFTAKADWFMSDEAQFFLKGYYHSWDTDYYTPGNPSAYWGYQDVGINAAAVLKPHDYFEYHIGYDFQRYEGEDEYLLIAKQQEEVNAFFAQVRSDDDLSERARFALGVRQDDTGGQRATVWNASGVYELTDSLYVQGMVGTSFMLPSAYNLYVIDCPSGEGCTHGNPNLEAEESESVNVSLGGISYFDGRQWEWKVTAWDRTVDNLITTAPIPVDMLGEFPDGFTRTFVNVNNEVDVQGAELLLDGEVTTDLSLIATYTYSKEVDSGSGEQIQDRPRHNYKLGARYQAPSGLWGMNLAAKYVGDKQSNVTGFGVQDYGNYTVFDLGAHIFLDGQARNHRVNVRLENLLDEEYATRVGSSALETSDTGERFRWNRLAPPRTLYVNYTYQF